MSAVTTAFGSVKSPVEIGFDTPPERITAWVIGEFVKGRAAHQRFLDKGRRPAFATKSEPFGLGFAFDEAWVADPTDTWLLANTAADYAERVVYDLAQQKADAQAQADSLIAYSADSSMAPLMEHYQSEALQEAMGVVAGYGCFTNEGFRPVIVRTTDAIAAQAKQLGVSTMPVSWHRGKVVEALNNKVSRGEYVDRGRVSLQFEINSDPERFGPALVWETGCDEIVFLAMGESTRAYQSGEQVWAMFYTPDMYEAPDRRTGEIMLRAGWYNKKGWGGIVKTFPSLDAASDALVDLSRAVRTIREADAERVKVAAPAVDRNGDELEDDEVRLARIARPRVSTL